MRVSFLAMGLMAAYGILPGESGPAPAVPEGAERPLWLENFRGELESADRAAGDFEATYSIESRKRLRAPKSAAPESEYVITRGKLTVRRRGGDVTATYDFFDENSTNGQVDEFIHTRELLFFEGGKLVARLDGDLLTYKPRTFARFQALPPFDTDWGYEFSPMGLMNPSEHAALLRSQPVKVETPPERPNVDKLVADGPEFSNKWAVAHRGSERTFDAATGAIEKCLRGMWLSWSDGAPEFVPLMSYEVLERRDGIAARARFVTRDSSAFGVLRGAGTLEGARAALREALEVPTKDVDMTLLKLRPLPVDAPVTIADHAASIGRIKRDEGAPEEFVSVRDPATGKLARVLEFDPSTGDWVKRAGDS